MSKSYIASTVNICNKIINLGHKWQPLVAVEVVGLGRAMHARASKMARKTWVLLEN